MAESDSLDLIEFVMDLEKLGLELADDDVVRLTRESTVGDIYRMLAARQAGVEPQSVGRPEPYDPLWLRLVSAVAQLRHVSATMVGWDTRPFQI